MYRVRYAVSALVTGVRGLNCCEICMFEVFLKGFFFDDIVEKTAKGPA